MSTSIILWGLGAYIAVNVAVPLIGWRLFREDRRRVLRGDWK